jgi:hypothetical protein
MNQRRDVRLLPRGRIAKWSKEQIDKLSTPDLRALLDNAKRLNEPEVAALCDEILDARPRGRPQAPRNRKTGPARRLVTRGKAFDAHGVSLRSRVWSRGGVRNDGAVVLAIAADGVQQLEGTHSYLLWAPNVGESHPWSDTPGGTERLEHCRIALERGAAEGLLLYGKPAGPERADPETVLQLRVEKRGEEYWATCDAPNRVVSTSE